MSEILHEFVTFFALENLNAQTVKGSMKLILCVLRRVVDLGLELLQWIPSRCYLINIMVDCSSVMLLANDTKYLKTH